MMSARACDYQEGTEITRSRPGHADLPGVLKYDRKDVRDILERASARETAARVAAGAVARKLLDECSIRLTSYVDQVGAVKVPRSSLSVDEIEELKKGTELGTIDLEIDKRMRMEIDKAEKDGDTVGGAFTVVAEGLPVGLGSHIQWDLKLSGRLAQAVIGVCGCGLYG